MVAVLRLQTTKISQSYFQVVTLVALKQICMILDERSGPMDQDSTMKGLITLHVVWVITPMYSEATGLKAILSRSKLKVAKNGKCWLSQID